MSNVREYGEAHGCFGEALGGGRSPDAATVFATRVFGDLVFSSFWTVGKDLSNPSREVLNELLVLLSAPFSFALYLRHREWQAGLVYVIAVLWLAFRMRPTP